MTTAPHTTAVIITYQSRHAIANAPDGLRKAHDRGVVYPDTDIPDARPLDRRGRDA
jgi:hypothetical protein